MSTTITQPQAGAALTNATLSSPSYSHDGSPASSGQSSEPSVLSMQTASHPVVTSSTTADAFLNQRAPKPVTDVTAERDYDRNLVEARFVRRVELVAVVVLLLFVVLGLATMLMDQQ